MRVYLTIAATVALLSFASAARSASTPIARLSGDVAPVSYDLSLQPLDAQNDGWTSMTVEGSETIVVRAERDVDAIVMNQSRIDVHQASIDGEAATVTQSQPLEQLRLKLAHPVLAGEHTLKLSFLARDPKPGFKLFSIAPVTLDTMFEESLARGVFPCFDEPGFRARFTLHVRAPSTWTVISNMPLVARTPRGDGTDVHDFAPTPPMPTYLLTFDMGELAHVDGMAGKTPLRVFVAPGKEPQARVVLADAERLLPFYERFFSTPFPMPKLDIVVLPGYPQVALEGWGAITSYSEDMAFGKQSDGGREGRVGALELIAHEMAHQWVGDLVDMAWWRDTFVAEGLAEFSDQRALAELYPELDPWIEDDRDVEEVLDGGVKRDSRPVVADIATDLDEADNAAFGGATYDKSAAVLRAWQISIGERAFRDALGRYLHAHAYGSATFEDFWRSFDDPRAVAYGDAWLKRPGFPVVDVDVVCSGGRSTVTLAQRAFVSNPRTGAAYRQQLWPFTLQIDIAGTSHTVLVPATRGESFDLPGCGIVSIDGTFRPYARVRYGTDAASALGVRPVRERLRVVNDYAALRGAGYLTAPRYLDAIVSPHVLDGIEVPAARVSAEQLDNLCSLLCGTPFGSAVVSAERTVLLPVAAPLARDGNAGALVQQATTRSLFALANAGDTRLSGASRDLFFQYAASGWPNTLAELQWGVAPMAGLTATRADIDRVEALMRDGQSADTGRMFLESVGDASLVPGVLDDARRDPRIAGSSFSDFLFATGRAHPALAYAYLRAHLREILAPIPPTQQAYVIAGGTANTLWSAVPQAEMIAYLRHTFPWAKGDVEAAAAQIARKWAARRALERSLSQPNE